MSSLNRLPAPGTVLASLALFAALGGTGYATTRSGPEERADAHAAVKKAGPRGPRGRTGKKGKTGPVGPQGPAGAAGAKGETGPQGGPGTAGAEGRSALSTLHSGETIRGVWGVHGDAAYGLTGITFPVPAPAPVDAAHVSGPSERTSGDGCTGTAGAPTAGAGYVCVYTARKGSTTTVFGVGGLGGAESRASADDDGSAYGFQVVTLGGGSNYGTGTWAYTAP